jgi:flagellar biosynthetic protein FliR
MNWDVPTNQMIAVLLATVRVSAWLLICPPLNSRLIPGPVKALLSVGLALPMSPTLMANVPSLETSALIVSIIEQVVVGASLGFITALFFAALQAAGDLIDVFGGFTLAFAFDPLSQSQSSVFGRFYNLLAVTLLFASNAHLLVLRGFLQSFESLPLNDTLSLETLSKLLTEGVGEMFLAALQIAGPLIAILFLTDVAFGLLNRVAPALSAFSLGFPAKIFLTLTLAGTAVTVLPTALDELIDTAVSAVVGITGG